MSREIKFRGLDLEFGYFLYGSLINYNPIPEIQVVELGEMDYDYQYYEVNPKTVGQFTGLKDKKGVEIYEGDILNCQDRIVKVVWHDQAGQWDTDFIRYIFDLCSNGITNQEWKYRAVVIGNIHENPELL